VAAPRAGAAWDIRGNGKTVLKGQWGRYLHLIAANAGSSFNPATVTATTYTWHDLNGNLLYDSGEVNLDPNGLDFVSLSQRSSASGLSTSSAPLRQFRSPSAAHRRDVGHDRAGTCEQDGGARPGRLQAHLRRLRQRPAPSFRTRCGNIPITRQDPGPDSVLGNSDDGGLVHVLRPFAGAYRGAAFDPTTPINRDSSRATTTYKGFELTLTKRQAGNWMALGSFQVIKNHIWTGTSATPSNPNQEIFAIDDTWDWSGKVMGSYRARRHDINLSAIYNFPPPGRRRQRTYQFPQRWPNANERYDPARATRCAARSRPARRETCARPNRCASAPTAVCRWPSTCSTCSTSTPRRRFGTSSSSTYGAISAILPSADRPDRRGDHVSELRINGH